MSPTDYPLMGFNVPHSSIMDGDFAAAAANVEFNSRGLPKNRINVYSEYWQPAGKEPGLSFDRLSSGGLATAVYTTTSPLVFDKELHKSDVLYWRFAAQSEYACDGTVTLSLIFDHGAEIILADKIAVPFAPNPSQEFTGIFIISHEEYGMPKVRLTLSSQHQINVFVEYVDLVLSTQAADLWNIMAKDTPKGIALQFNHLADIYRSDQKRSGYTKIASSAASSFLDTTAVPGRTYYYCAAPATTAIGRMASYPVAVTKLDDGVSLAPTDLIATASKWEVALAWTDPNHDTEFYNIYRADSISETLSLLTYHHPTNQYVDLLPIKGGANTYAITAVDFSGNESPLSATAIATVSAVPGASFSDLILPLPITETFVSDGIWGEPYTKPRDINNGIEDNEFSYWGGRIVEEDGKYHINIVRWPENTRKGHWDWPKSTVAYAVSDSATGPFKIVRSEAYTYTTAEGVDNFNSSGHNANIILMNDGSYLLYILVRFVPIILSSKSIAGPWKYEGILEVDAAPTEVPHLRNNLSGLQLDDGSIYFMSRRGIAIRSDVGILGPYQVLCGPTSANESLPAEYRNSDYEDPVVWKDEVQFHMIINAFLDLRAVYLRSPDGINWFYEDGFAYAPSLTVYTDGTRTLWHKVERPNVLVDQFGRATHLTMAAIDYAKELDYPNDNHSSKNQVLPLIVYRRLRWLGNMQLLILTENSMSNDFDLDSFRLGSSIAVNFGGGATVAATTSHPDGIALTFVGDTQLSDAPSDFAAKLIGKTAAGELVVGYVRV